MTELCTRCGLPEAIHSDNGAPFASTGIHGLNRPKVWWLQLGIVHPRITPGSHLPPALRPALPESGLNHEYVGFEEIADNLWNVGYYETLLGASTNAPTSSPGAPSARRRSVNHVPGHSVSYVPGCSALREVYLTWPQCGTNVGYAPQTWQVGHEVK